MLPKRDKGRTTEPSAVDAAAVTFIETAPQWTVPQLSIMIIYNSTWSILIQ